MQPNGAGVRHCDACQKTVTDFTGMTDRQLIAHLERNGFGCGRFRDNQLSRDLSVAEPRKLPVWGKALAAGLGLLLSFGQKSAASVKKASPVNAVDHAGEQPSESPMPDSVQIRGSVFDPEGKGLAAWPVNLYLNGAKVDTVYTDDKGDFITEKIPVAWLNGDLKVRVTHSFITREQVITNYAIPVRIQFAPDVRRPSGLTGAYRTVIRKPLPKRKSFFRRLQFWRREKQRSRYIIGCPSF